MVVQSKRDPLSHGHGIDLIFIRRSVRSRVVEESTIDRVDEAHELDVSGNIVSPMGILEACIIVGCSAIVGKVESDVKVTRMDSVKIVAPNGLDGRTPDVDSNHCL